MSSKRIATTCKTVLLFLLMYRFNVSVGGANNTKSNPSCNFCFYDSNSSLLPAPEVLWATSSKILLRARDPCSCALNRNQKSQLVWRISYRIDAKSTRKNEILMSNFNNLSFCNIQNIKDDREYCMYKKTRESYGNDVSLQISIEDFQSEAVSTSFCPESKLPPEPQDVKCTMRRGFVEVRWRHVPDPYCSSYAQLMVKSSPVGPSLGDGWLWIGEVPPKWPHGYGAFAGKVRPCWFNSSQLCTNLSADVSVVELGVRRIDVSISDETISKALPVKCTNEKNHNDGQTMSPNAIETNSFLGDHETTSSKPVETRELTNKSEQWYRMALASFATLIITICLIPLAFFAGWRWRRNESCRSRSSWCGRSPSRTDEMTLPPYSKFPPAYAYEYVDPISTQTTLGWQRPPVPPPPPPPPSPRVLPALPPSVDVRNVWYDS